MLSWLVAISRGRRVGVYLSDVSGAFDRVSATRLLTKLHAAGASSTMVNFIAAWLRDRQAVAIVNGCGSDPYTLTNSVFQGTVLGPPLWNIHYADAGKAVASLGFEESMFADDLLAHKAFDAHISDTEVLRQLRECQSALHRWGQANQVTFDPGKEELKILHRRCNLGVPFKHLGVLFDTKLKMDVAIDRITAEVGWRQQSLLMTRPFHGQSEVITLYKSFILSYAEYATPAIYHATPFHLWRLDQTQLRFLDELGLDLKAALLIHNLAPFNTRRDIAMLALIHRIVIGKAHTKFDLFIKPARVAHFPGDLRGTGLRHDNNCSTPLSVRSRAPFAVHFWAWSTRTTACHKRLWIYGRCPAFNGKSKTRSRWQQSVTCKAGRAFYWKGAIRCRSLRFKASSNNLSPFNI